jgi:hypothetical protein
MKKRQSYKEGSYLDPFDLNESSGMKPFSGQPTHFSDQAPVNRPGNLIRPTPVALPPHLFIPDNAQSLDIRRLASVLDGTENEVFMSFQSPTGSKVQFIGYSIFSDGTLAAVQEFIPRVNGKRVFPYHGDPNNGFRINLGLGPDMSNANVIQCNLTLNPGEILTWSVTNLSGVNIAMGVRMVGYIDYTQTRVNARVGG